MSIAFNAHPPLCREWGGYRPYGRRLWNARNRREAVITIRDRARRVEPGKRTDLVHPAQASCL